MKHIASFSLIAALSISSLSFAQAVKSTGMEMKGMHGMDMKKCADMKEMPGMAMKHMDSEHCQKMMKGMEKKQKASDAVTHQADGTVKVLDPISSKVTLDHDAIKSLGWPAMTMAFVVKDKALFNKLAVGNKVHVEFNKQGSDYVLTSVK